MSGFDLYEWVKGMRQKTEARRGGRGNVPPPVNSTAPRPEPTPPWRRLLGVAVAGGVVYGLSFCEDPRGVGPPGHLVVVVKKNGSKRLPEGELLMPRAP